MVSVWNPNCWYNDDSQCKQEYTPQFLHKHYVCIISWAFPCMSSIKHVLISQYSGKLHKKAHIGFYFVSLISLWISVTIKFACDWATIQSAFVGNSDSPFDINNKLAHPVLHTLIIGGTSGIMCVLLSDAILVRMTLTVQEISWHSHRYGAAMQCGLIDISWLPLPRYCVRL